MIAPERSVPISSSREQFDRLLQIVHKAHKKRGLNAALTVCVSMLAVVQSFMIATLGHEEARRLMQESMDLGFQKTRAQ